MTKSAIKCVAAATLAFAAPSSAASRNGSGLDLLHNVGGKNQRVAKQDIWLEERSAGRLQNTRQEHLAPSIFFDQWQGYYSAEIAAFSC
ncbi:unnamed protein product [Ectocarpus sp. 13 AM-2016]